MTITAGLVIFNIGKMKGGFADESLLGIFLVIFSLIFDGFVGSVTVWNNTRKGRSYAYLTMFYNSFFGIIFNCSMYAFVRYTKGDDTFERTLADMNLMKEVIMISLFGAFGQIFIFLTISVLDMYTLAIITTTRKCLTVCFSAFLFSHNFTMS